jgi:glycosyltransferase involved in cell wall biosynthesis
MREPTVSVVIPTHNRPALVQRAIRSVLAQTRLPDEIIVVDDGSTDNTARVVQAFRQVRYLRQEHKGVSAARNRGIRAAQGDWLALLDSDDEWRPTKLAVQLIALARAPECLLCHSNEIWIRRGRRVNPMGKHAKTGGYIFRRCLPLCVISPSAAVLHRSLFEAVGLFDESLPVCEDYDLWLRVCARYPVLYVDEPLIVKYGGHSDQLSRQYWGMDRFRIQALEKLLQSSILDQADQAAACRMLAEKIDIYLQGARKRGKWQEVTDYEQRREVLLKHAKGDD